MRLCLPRLQYRSSIALSQMLAGTGDRMLPWPRADNAGASRSHQSERSPKDFEAERRGVQDRSGTTQSWTDISGYGQWLSAKTWLGSKANIAPVRSRVRNLVPVTRPGPKPGHEPEHGIGFTQQSDAVPGVDHERLLGSGTATLRPVSRDWTAASAMARAARPSVPSE